VPKWSLLFGTLATMLLLAWLTHRLVERPLAPRMKRMLVRSLDELRTAGPGISPSRSSGSNGSSGSNRSAPLLRLAQAVIRRDDPADLDQAAERPGPTTGALDDGVSSSAR
jgi:hypothetical protein